MFSRVVKKSWLYVPTEELPVPLKTEMERLTVQPKFGGDPIEMFDYQNGWFGYPLHYHRVLQERSVQDARVSASIKIEFRGELNPNQKVVMEKFSDAVVLGKTGFILEAPPGWGKTVFAIAVMSIIKQRTLVVVPRSNLIKQWRERLLKFSDLKPKDIGWVEGGKGEWEGKKVVVGLVHSVVLDRLGVEFRRAFGLVVFDEVDRSVPPQTFAPAIAMFPALYRIGMSATLKRQDGMEVIFQHHIGEVYLKGGDENRMKPKVLVAYYNKSSGYVPMTSQKMNRRGMLISRLAENPDRNLKLAKYVLQIYKSDRQVVVLSDRKAQLQEIRKILVMSGVVPREIGYYVRSLDGKSFTQGQRARSASVCKIILGTYGMMALGTDIPKLAGLVYATPQSEVQQSKGRIERLLDGKKEPVVVDVVDTKYGDTLRWAVNRRRRYMAEGLNIININ